MYVIGTIYKPTGKMLTDDEGMEYPETSPIDGFHVNSPYEIAEFSEYEVQVNTPQAVYAGHETFFYSFPDEATFNELNPYEPS